MVKNKLMPVLFVGHGSPMNAIENNEFSRKWESLGRNIPRPKAIVCISAHWETKGTSVTSMNKPKTIHDFGGFPEELYEIVYPASGSKSLAQEIKDSIKSEIKLDESWGLDHGTWSVLRRMYPLADIPVIQLSIDFNKSMQEHYELAKQLSFLRQKGILIIGSGNLVHNLMLVEFHGDFNEDFGFDWAIEANEIFKKLISKNDYSSLINFKSLGKSVQLAIPTTEHYIPMIYSLALKKEGESIQFFNDKAVAGSLTMTSFLIS